MTDSPRPAVANVGTPLPTFGTDELGRPNFDRYRWVELASRSLAGPEIRVALAVAWFAHHATGRNAHPGNNRIAHMAGYTNPDNARTVLKALRRKGWINQVAPGKGTRPALWELALPPIESGEVSTPRGPAGARILPFKKAT